MPFPVGVQTVTVTAGASGYRALDGDAYQGTIRLTPSVSRVVSATHGVIALGPENITLGASGEFSKALLATDASGFSPSGWTYRVDEEFTGAPGRSYNISLPASAATVALSTLTPVESSTGVEIGAETAGTAAAAVATHGADTTDVHGISNTALLETQSGAASKVSVHSAAADPHGDRAYANSTFATQTTVTAIDGFVGDLLTRVQNIETGAAFLAGANFTAPVLVHNSRVEVRDSGANPLHRLDGATNTVGFFGATPTGRPTVTGSRGGNAALASLLTALAGLGLITDSTTA